MLRIGAQRQREALRVAWRRMFVAAARRRAQRRKDAATAEAVAMAAAGRRGGDGCGSSGSGLVVPTVQLVPGRCKPSTVVYREPHEPPPPPLLPQDRAAFSAAVAVEWHTAPADEKKKKAL